MNENILNNLVYKLIQAEIKTELEYTKHISKDLDKLYIITQ